MSASRTRLLGPLLACAVLGSCSSSRDEPVACPTIALAYSGAIVYVQSASTGPFSGATVELTIGSAQVPLPEVDPGVYNDPNLGLGLYPVFVSAPGFDTSSTSLRVVQVGSPGCGALVGQASVFLNPTVVPAVLVDLDSGEMVRVEVTGL